MPVACAIIAFSAVDARQPHSTFRFHVEANARDTEAFATQFKSPFTGRPMVIEKMATLSEQDVVAFAPYPAKDGSFGVLLQLDDHGRIALDTLSVEHRGQSAFVFMNGRPVTELQIDRRISDGKIYIPTGLTRRDIELMRRNWKLIGKR